MEKLLMSSHWTPPPGGYTLVSTVFITWSYIAWTVSTLPVSRTQHEKTLTESDGLSYLEQFGYLPADDHKTASLRTEESFNTALRNFQRMAGIPISA